MRVIENNYGDKFPKRVRCICCGSELEIERNDINFGYLGMAFVTCPLCGSDINVEECDRDITKDTLEFPEHFYHFEDKNLDNEIYTMDIRKYVNSAINFFRENPSNFCYFTGSGDLAVFVMNYPGDEEYQVIICKGYYETSLRYTKDDYEIDMDSLWKNKGVVVRDIKENK